MEAINHLLRSDRNTTLLTINATFFLNKWDRHIQFVHRVGVGGGWAEMNK